MDLRPVNDPYGGDAVLVDKMIGSAFKTVRDVAEKLEQIKYIADNMQAIVQVGQAEENLADLATAGPAALAAATAATTAAAQAVALLAGVLSGLNASGALVTPTGQVGAQSLADIAASAIAETPARVAADGILQTAIAAETSARIASLADYVQKAGFSLSINGAQAGDIFVGSGLHADMWGSVHVNAASATVPEITAQFAMNSNTGLANKDSAYKIGLTASALGGPNSADIYGGNIITQGYGGTHLVTGFESDVNNIGVDSLGLSTPTSVYGLVSVAAGTAASTAGLWVVATSTGSWTHGIAVSQANISSFFEGAVSTIGLSIHGAHTTGIDMLAGFPISVAMALPNNTPIQQKDATNTLRNLINTDTSSRVILGDSGGGAITFLNNLEPFGDNVYSLGRAGARLAALWAANGTVQTSDPAQKTDITPLPPALPMISVINPVTWKWISGGKVPVQSTEIQTVPATETIEEEVEDIQIINGIATLTKITRSREVPIVDTFPLFDANGNPVMGRASKNNPAVQRTHQVPRMITKEVPVTTYVDRAGARTHWGFLAPDVKAATPEGMDWAAYVMGEDGIAGVRPDQMLPVAWKGIQELYELIKALSAEFSAYKVAHP